jgi:hypothetical protein
MDLDRFAVGLPDAQDARVVALCASCDGEIYSGEIVYRTQSGTLLHANYDCVCDYFDLTMCEVDDVLNTTDQGA